MKKWTATVAFSAFCLLPAALAAADLPWAQQMRDAANPDALKADQFISFRETDSGMLKLAAGDTTLELNPKKLQVTLKKGDSVFALRTDTRRSSCRMVLCIPSNFKTQNRLRSLRNSGPESAASS